MMALWITIVIVVGVIFGLCVCCYAEFKENELEFKKEQNNNVTKLTADETTLEIEREKTKQLQIKADYREKFNSSLY